MTHTAVVVLMTQLLVGWLLVEVLAVQLDLLLSCSSCVMHVCALTALELFC